MRDDDKPVCTVFENHSKSNLLLQHCAPTSNFTFKLKIAGVTTSLEWKSRSHKITNLDTFSSKRIRQTEVRSTLLSWNVNKLSQFFFLPFLTFRDLLLNPYLSIQ